MEMPLSFAGALSLLVGCDCHHTITQVGLNNRHLFSCNSASFRSKIKVLADFISPEAFLFVLQMVAFWLCPYLAFPLGVCILGPVVCPVSSLQIFFY